MHAYITLCLATGIRTEEARALRWEHVDSGDPVANPPVPASAAVWRSVRSHGDTKTDKSRRTLALPEMAVNALWAHKERQADDRAAAGRTWADRDLVFSTRTGAALGMYAFRAATTPRPSGFQRAICASERVIRAVGARDRCIAVPAGPHDLRRIPAGDGTTGVGSTSVVAVVRRQLPRTAATVSG